MEVGFSTLNGNEKRDNTDIAFDDLQGSTHQQGIRAKASNSHRDIDLESMRGQEEGRTQIVIHEFDSRLSMMFDWIPPERACTGQGDQHTLILVIQRIEANTKGCEENDQKDDRDVQRGHDVPLGLRSDAVLVGWSRERSEYV